MEGTRQFLGRHIIDVLVEGWPGSILILDTVEPAISMAREGEIGIADGSGKRTSMRFGFRVRAVHRDAESGPSDSGSSRQGSRRFETRGQTACRSHGRVCERSDDLGVLQNSADVMEAICGHPGVLVAVEEGLAAFRWTGVCVQAPNTVSAEQGLGHERYRSSRCALRRFLIMYLKYMSWSAHLNKAELNRMHRSRPGPAVRHFVVLFSSNNR